MPKINRVNLKQFAGSVPALNNIAKFGSLAQGNPQFSLDPAQIQSLDPFIKGWVEAVVGDKNPALEDMNALFYLAFYQLRYILQQGVPEWDPETTYYKGSIVSVLDLTGRPNLMYSMIDDNTGSDPRDADNIGTVWASKDAVSGFFGFSMFDFKFADRILSGPEADGWLLAGSSFSRANYQEAFDAVKYGFDNGQSNSLVIPTPNITGQPDTITIPCRIAPNKQLIIDNSNSAATAALSNLYNLTGIADFYQYNASGLFAILPRTTGYIRATNDPNLVNRYGADRMLPIVAELMGMNNWYYDRWGYIPPTITLPNGQTAPNPAYRGGGHSASDGIRSGNGDSASQQLFDTTRTGAQYNGDQVDVRHANKFLYYLLKNTQSVENSVAESAARAVAASEAAELAAEHAEEIVGQLDALIGQIEQNTADIQDINSELSDLDGDLVNEINRATTAENTLQTNINAEEASREHVDAGLNELISNEVSRAQGAEAALDSAKINKSAVPQGTSGPTNNKRTLLQAITIDVISAVSAFISGWSTDIESDGAADIETQVALPIVDSAHAGLMPAADHNQIITNTGAIATANTNISAQGTRLTTAEGDIDNLEDAIDALAPVASSGSYNDLTNKPTIPAAQIQSDWTQATTTAKDYIKNKPSLATVASTGSYADLTNKPNIPPDHMRGTYADIGEVPLPNDASWTPAIANGDYVVIGSAGTAAVMWLADLSDNEWIEGGGTGAITAEVVKTLYESNSNTNAYTDAEKSKLGAIAARAEMNVQSDWNETGTSADAYIKNKPALATVATSGSYNDLSNKPTIPAAQIQSDWNQTSTSAKDYIKNKPVIPEGAGQATNTTLGVVKGSTAAGQAYVETDGTLSLNGYDALTTGIANANTAIAGKVDKITLPGQVYATGISGSQTSLTYGTPAAANRIVQRGNGGEIVVSDTPYATNCAVNQKYVDDAIATVPAPTPTTYNIASEADVIALNAAIRKTNHNTPITINITGSFSTAQELSFHSLGARINTVFQNSAILTYTGTGDTIIRCENSYIGISNCRIVGKAGVIALRCRRGGTIEVQGTCNISGCATALDGQYAGIIIMPSLAGLTLTGNTENYPTACIFGEDNLIKSKTDAERFLDTVFAKNPNDPASKAWKEPAIPQTGDVVNGVLQHPDHSGGAGA